MELLPSTVPEDAPKTPSSTDSLLPLSPSQAPPPPLVKKKLPVKLTESFVCFGSQIVHRTSSPLVSASVNLSDSVFEPDVNSYMMTWSKSGYVPS